MWVRRGQANQRLGQFQFLRLARKLRFSRFRREFGKSELDRRRQVPQPFGELRALPIFDAATLAATSETKRKMRGRKRFCYFLGENHQRGEHFKRDRDLISNPDLVSHVQNAPSSNSSLYNKYNTVMFRMQYSQFFILLIFIESLYL